MVSSCENGGVGLHHVCGLHQINPSLGDTKHVLFFTQPIQLSCCAAILNVATHNPPPLSRCLCYPCICLGSVPLLLGPLPKHRGHLAGDLLAQTGPLLGDAPTIRKDRIFQSPRPVLTVWCPLVASTFADYSERTTYTDGANRAVLFWLPSAECGFKLQLSLAVLKVPCKLLDSSIFHSVPNICL